MRHFLNSCNYEFSIFVLCLFCKSFCIICPVYTVFFIFIKVVCSLCIKVATVYEEKDFFDFWMCYQKLCTFPASKSFSSPSCMPDITVIIRRKSFIKQKFCSINLIWTHNHHAAFCII